MPTATTTEDDDSLKGSRERNLSSPILQLAKPFEWSSPWGPLHEFLLHSEYGDNFDEWPDDVDNEHEYLAIPRNRDLDLGQPLVFAFARDFLPDEYDEVRRIFTRRGAYARFKDLLVRRKALGQWHAFENAATERALRHWCDENGVVVEREDRAPGDAVG